MVLIVEDDVGIREALQLGLELEGYEVVTAENGRAALDLLSHVKRPCLILLDLMMPVMDGWAFAGEVDRLAELATVPLVIVTAFPEPGADLTTRAAAVLKKPVSLEGVLQWVKHYCDSPAGASGGNG